MTGPDDRWTAQDLEWYLDDELTHDHRAELTDALRKDPELRNRLASIAHLDDELRTLYRKMATDKTTEQRRSFRRSTLPWVLTAAACLIMSVLAANLFQSYEDLRRELVHNSDTPADHGGVSRHGYEAVRVVFSLPAKPPDRQGLTPDGMPGEDPRKVEKDAPAAPNDDHVFHQRLAGLLASGSVENTTALLSHATDEQRNVALAAIGDLLRSAEVAERVLDRLSPQEQLAACRVWLRTQAFLPQVFEQLRKLSAQPEYAKEVQTVLTSIEAEPTLRKWLRSERLRT